MAIDGVMGTLFIPFGIGGQSLSAFDPTNGVSDHADMDIQRSNVRFLIARSGKSDDQVGKESGAGQSWLSRWLARKIEKTNSDKLDMIADYFSVSRADIRYQDLSQPGAVPASQPTGHEAVILQAAVKIEAMLADLALTPPPKDRYAQRLFVAGQVAREIGADAILSGERLVEGVKALAARLRAVGEG